MYIRGFGKRRNLLRARFRRRAERRRLARRCPSPAGADGEKRPDLPSKGDDAQERALIGAAVGRGHASRIEGRQAARGRRPARLSPRAPFRVSWQSGRIERPATGGSCGYGGTSTYEMIWFWKKFLHLKIWEVETGFPCQCPDMFRMSKTRKKEST